MSCSICEHASRKAIEEHLLTFNYGNEGMTLKNIAEKFSVPVSDLQVHALMHSSIVALEGSEGASLVQDIKKREAGVLSQVIDEYWVTLRLTGKILREDLQGDLRGRGITKHMVEMYISAGNNIRQTVQTIADMNTSINGEQDRGINALADVVSAIRMSAERHTSEAREE